MTTIEKLFSASGIKSSTAQTELFCKHVQRYIEESCMHYDPDSAYLAQYIVDKLLKDSPE